MKTERNTAPPLPARAVARISDPLAVECPNCGGKGTALSTCRECGEFIPVVVALAHVNTTSMWHVKKSTQGAQAGKWALFNPLGRVQWYYRQKRVAERDSLALNMGNATPASRRDMYRLRSVGLEADLLRAIGLTDSVVAERDALRADRSKLVEALRDLIALDAASLDSNHSGRFGGAFDPARALLKELGE